MACSGRGGRLLWAMLFSSRFGIPAGVVALAWAGCAPGPELGQLKIRAAYDMSCSDRDDIRVKSLGNDVYDAEGCGKTARYSWVCEGHAPMSPCKWVRNPEPKPRPAASAGK